MSLIRFRKRLSSVYTLFIKAPKRWLLPQRSEILFYDGSGLEALMPYLKGYSLYVHYTRGEEVNVPCLFMALFDMSFWKGKPLNAYVRQAVKMVAPKVVVTFIDNNPAFYRISSDSPETATIFIQNGMRGGGADVFVSITKGETYKVDYMLTFNNAIAAKYKEFIHGEAVVIGSLKNNHVSNLDMGPSVPDTVLFISQYRKKNDPLMYVDAHGRSVYWDEFYKPDAEVVKWLGMWCTEHNKKLRICGCALNDEMHGELSWYESVLDLNGLLWEYLPKSTLYDSYRAVKKNEIIVGIDSSLAYEAFGAGEKTAFLSVRGHCIDDEEKVFAWPAGLPDSGLFWSNHFDKSELFRIMDYLTSVSDHDWKLVHEQYRDDVMAYDPGNTILQQLLDKLLSTF